MKTFKDIISEVAEPKARREKDFKDKHVIQKIGHPVANETQFTTKNITKDKTKRASMHDGEDASVYEEVEQIDELSKDLLGRYAAKAHNRGDMASRMSNHGRNKDMTKIANKRYYGVKNALNKLSGRARVNAKEEVEQIDELSQDKLMSYHAKAATDLRKKREKLAKGKLTMKDYKKGQNRVTGLNRAANKMNEEMSDAEMKKREDIVMGMKKSKADLKKRYGDRWKSVMYATATKNAMKESVEQIDELSKKTLGSYVKKASADQYFKGQAAQYHDNKAKKATGPFAKETKKKHYALAAKANDKASNRDTGISRAVNRLTKEEYMDEAFKAGSMKLADGSSVKVTSEQANVLNSLFNELNFSNKKKMEERLMSGSKGFNEILSFAKEAL